ncbi:MAG: rod shape-determining protein MreC [Proteobacteria bacterium]|nr:rod shape-determining protein MreC [Pseudomonadota bacterium]
MFRFIKNNRLRISIVVIFLFFLLYLATQVEIQRSENWYSATIHTISYPFQATFHFIKRNLTETWHSYLWLVDVKEENDRLWARVWELEEENARAREIRFEHDRLRDILEFKKKDPNVKVFAEVIFEVKKPFFQLLVINKGSDDGIRSNFAVVSPEGIIGKIQSVTANQSVVQMITDSRSQFPVLIQRTRTKAMSFGSLDGTITIKRIPRRQEIFKDDQVVTSGLAGVFPKGFPVGKVDKIDKQPYGLFQSVTLTPAVDLSKVEEVAVLLRNVDNIHQPLFTDLE